MNDGSISSDASVGPRSAIVFHGERKSLDSNQRLTEEVANVLESVRKKGVKLWTEDGKLHYRAPRGALAQQELAILRLSRSQIVGLLENAVCLDTVESTLEPPRSTDRAPLTFSQVAHWKLFRLGERRATRQVACALRLRGRLNINALQRSVAEVVRRHDALRTRIVVSDGAPTQQIADSIDCELETEDLTAVPERLREMEVKGEIEKLILEPIDVSAGPLFGLRLLKLDDHEHVLIAALEHMISDGFSLNILSREIFAAYVQAVKGRAFSLPPIPIQFSDYAILQRRKVEKSSIERHGAYWKEHLADSRRLRFPDDKHFSTSTHSGMGSVPIRISRDLKAELREWCRVRRTTIVMSVFTAYVGVVLRWCGAAEGVFQYTSDSRNDPKVERTIGYFAGILCLRIQTRNNDSFIDLLNLVTDEYCKASEHSDCSYTVAQQSLPEYARNTCFNWAPQGTCKIDLSELGGTEDAMSCTPVRFVYPTATDYEMDREPTILLFDSDEEIVGNVYFSLGRVSVDTMERFARNFLLFISALLRTPEGRVKDVQLV